MSVPFRTDEQKKRRYEEALNGFIDYIPSMKLFAFHGAIDLGRREKIKQNII